MGLVDVEEIGHNFLMEVRLVAQGGKNSIPYQFVSFIMNVSKLCLEFPSIFGMSAYLSSLCHVFMVLITVGLLLAHLMDLLWGEPKEDETSRSDAIRNPTVVLVDLAAVLLVSRKQNVPSTTPISD